MRLKTVPHHQKDIHVTWVGLSGDVASENNESLSVARYTPMGRSPNSLKAGHCVSSYSLKFIFKLSEEPANIRQYRSG
jgi:hypothetical protein